MIVCTVGPICVNEHLPASLLAAPQGSRRDEVSILPSGEVIIQNCYKSSSRMSDLLHPCA